VIVTWPMPARIETAVTDEGDPLHLSWILDWDIHALTHHPLHIFDAPVFHPAKYPLAFSENLIAVAALALPFRLLGLGPVAIYNVALLLGIALSAWSAYLLGWTLTRKFAPALMAGLLYGFMQYRFGHIQHLQIVWSAGLALLLAAIVLYLRAPATARAALVAAALASNALMNIYNFLFGSVMLLLSLALIAIAGRRDKRFWLRLAAALAVAALAIAPILAPYWIVSKEYAMERNAGEALDGSARPYDWFIAGGRSLVYDAITDPGLRRSERELFPGLMLLALPFCALLMWSGGLQAAGGGLKPAAPRTRRILDIAIVILAVATYFALITDRVRIAFHGRTLLAYRGTTAVTLLLVIAILARLPLRAWLARSRFPLEMWIAALWIAFGFIGSLGMHTPFHTFLFESVPGFRATRAPARWAMVGYTGLAAWAAWGMTVVATKRWRAVLLFALALLDVWPSIRWMHTLVEPAAVDLWIAREYAGPVYLLPFDRGEPAYQMLYRATAHHQPMFNGLSSFEPPLHSELTKHSYDARTMEILEQHGGRFVVVRPEWCGWEAVPIFAWLRDNLAAGRLAFVRRFDYGSGGDWVFAVTRNERRWTSPPSEELARLLDGKSTRSGITFGRMSTPRMYDEVTGALEISGLAMSPHGVRGVTALIANGRVRVTLPLFERADYSAAFPWYPQTPRPAFALRIPARPKDIWKYTDVQIEIVDGRGAVTRLQDAPITWN